MQGLFLHGGQPQIPANPAKAGSILKMNRFMTWRCLSCAPIVYQLALYIAQGARKVLRPRIHPSNSRRCRRALPWRTRSKRRSESVEGQPYRHWGWPGYLCRWRAERPRQLTVRQRIFRRWIPQRITKSRSVRRKSLTSAWQRSMSSTRKMPEHPSEAKGYNLQLAAVEAAGAVGAGAVASAEAAEAAEVVWEAAEAAAAAVAGGGEEAAGAAVVAARPGEHAAGARLRQIPVTFLNPGSGWPGGTFRRPPCGYARQLGALRPIE